MLRDDALIKVCIGFHHSKVTSWSGAESAHPIIGDVRIKYVSVYPDGKVISWSEGAGDPGAIGSI